MPQRPCRQAAGPPRLPVVVIQAHCRSTVPLPRVRLAQAAVGESPGPAEPELPMRQVAAARAGSQSQQAEEAAGNSPVRAVPDNLAALVQDIPPVVAAAEMGHWVYWPEGAAAHHQKCCRIGRAPAPLRGFRRSRAKERRYGPWNQRDFCANGLDASLRSAGLTFRLRRIQGPAGAGSGAGTSTRCRRPLRLAAVGY